MAISAELKRIYAGSDQAQTYVETLAFSHPAFLKSHFVTNDVVGWTFELEDGSTQDFDPVPFELVLPTHDDQGRQDLQVSICNVGREMMEELERASVAARDPVSCTYRVFLDIPNTVPQNDPVTRLTILQVDVTFQTITAVAGRSDVLNRSFPSDIYRIDNFPGLDR